MKIAALGHVVLKVRDLKRAEDFYHGLLGIPIQARTDPPTMTFFSLGQHHDFAVLAVGDDAPTPDESSLGIHHVAFRLAGGLPELRNAKQRLEAENIQVAGVDHVVTQSLYFRDPDGNPIELFIDGSDAWKDQPDLVLKAGPLDL